MLRQTTQGPAPSTRGARRRLPVRIGARVRVALDKGGAGPCHGYPRLPRVHEEASQSQSHSLPRLHADRENRGEDDLGAPSSISRIGCVERRTADAVFSLNLNEIGPSAAPAERAHPSSEACHCFFDSGNRTLRSANTHCEFGKTHLRGEKNAGSTQPATS